MWITFSITGLLLIISVTASLLKPTFLPLFSVISLFFPLLWLIVALYLVLFIFIRKKLVIVPVLLLLAGAYQISLVFNISMDGNTGYNANNLNLISLNTGNPDSVDLLESRQNTFSQELFTISDIICLQEFAPIDETGIKLLEDFNSKINVDYYGIPEGDSSGLSVYSKYEIIDYGWLKQEEEDTYALWCHIFIDNDTVTIINVQLQSIRLDEEEIESMTNFWQIINLPGNIVSIYSKLERGFQWREEQVNKLSELIKSSKYPVILCGDFNDPPSSNTYKKISDLLIDTYVEQGSGFGTTYAGKLPFLRIDYVMIDNQFNVVKYQKLKETYSDHYPIYVEVGR